MFTGFRIKAWLAAGSLLLLCVYIDLPNCTDHTRMAGHIDEVPKSLLPSRDTINIQIKRSQNPGNKHLAASGKDKKDISCGVFARNTSVV